MSHDVDSLLIDLIGRLTDDLRAGRGPDVESAAREHPEVAGELRELWAAALIAEELAQALQRRRDDLPPAAAAPPCPARGARPDRRRLHDPRRPRPRRDGDRLPRRAARIGPGRRAEATAARDARRRPRRRPAPPRGVRRGAGSSIRISSRSTTWGCTTASRSSSCSSSRGRRWRGCSPTGPCPLAGPRRSWRRSAGRSRMPTSGACSTAT